MNQGSIISLNKAFYAMTIDIITNHFFSFHYNYINIPDLKFPVQDTFLGILTIFHLSRFVPWLIMSLKMLPKSVIQLIQKPIADLQDLQEQIEKDIKKVRGKKDIYSPVNKSIIIEALNDEEIPLRERSIGQLMNEGQVIIFTGTKTSSHALAVGIYYILSNRSIIKKMRAELSAISNMPNKTWILQQLENLPYLVGITIFEYLNLANKDTDWYYQREYLAHIWSFIVSPMSFHQRNTTLQWL
jgi:hypothetical protein